MKLLISTYAFQGFKPENAFLFAKVANIDGLELVPMPAHAFMGAKKLKALSEKHNVPIISVHQPPWHWPHAARGMIKNAARFSHFLGAQNLSLHLSLLRLHKRETIFSYVRKLEKEIGLTISMENNRPAGKSLEFPKKWAWEPKSLDNLIEEYDFDITLDNAHYIEAGGEPSEFFLRHKKRIKNVHFHNVSEDKDHGSFANAKTSDKIFSLLDVLKKENYNGLLTLEIFPNYSSGKKLGYKDIEYELKKSIEMVRARLEI